LTLDSSDGKSLSLSRSPRQNTQGSVTTVQSFESPAAAYTRMQEKKIIRGLVVEFHDAHGMCLPSLQHMLPFQRPEKACTTRVADILSNRLS